MGVVVDGGEEGLEGVGLGRCQQRHRSAIDDNDDNELSGEQAAGYNGLDGLIRLL